MQDRGWYGNVIAWFANNSVAANLLMWTLILSGLYAGFTITKEVFPRIETNYVTVNVPYRGGTPRDVEQGVLIRIEEAIQDLDGIKEIVSTAREGSGTVRVEIQPEYDITEALDNIKNRVDAISTFPAETERPIYERTTWTEQVIWVNVFGDVPERTLKEVGRQVRDEIVALPDVARAELIGDRPYEIGVEVREETLRAYDLTLAEVADAVRRSSLDLPGGRIEAAGGDILLRTMGQAYTGRDFANIVVRTNPDGSRIVLSDIAEIDDGFVERERYARHNGRPTVAIEVLSVGQQDALQVAEAVREYIDQRRQTLPEGVSLDWWGDASFYLKDRLNMMTKNLALGAGLVFLILALFLRLKLAFWVMVGLLVAFAGTLAFLPSAGVTINLVSLFGFLVVLGIVVDDAIVIGESTYTEIRQHGHSVDNVVNGTMKVAVPATFGVVTTMAAFLPILMVTGISGQFFAPIGWVVIIALAMSLLESKLILPAHLAHMRVKQYDPDTSNRWIRFQRSFSDSLFKFVDRFYLPSLQVMLRNRYITLAGFLAALILSIGFVAGPSMRVVLFPDNVGDFVRAELEMNEGTPGYVTHNALDRLQQTLDEVDEEMQREFDLDGPIVRTVFAFSNSETSGNMVVELHKTDDPKRGIPEIERRWRDKTGQIAGAKGLRIGAAGGGPGGDGPDLSFQLIGRNLQSLQRAAAELEARVREFEGTYDVRNDFAGGIRELQLRIKPEAEVLGLSQRDLARQVRHAFFGEEVQRIQRGQDDVRVMVRYPREQRTSQGYLEQMRIRTPNGEQIPFGAVAEIEMGSSPSTIRRYNRERSISVTSRIDKDIAEPGEVQRALTDEIIPGIISRYAGVSYKLSGQSQNARELTRQLVAGTIFTLFLVYALIAIPLRSYVQPLLIMSVIPFGTIGAVFGHWLLGIPVSMLSMFGIIALAGVVVNDSLILVDFVNRHCNQGESPIEAALRGARARFRPIVLTSMTTFLGLAPIVFFETSLQAQSVIPMATSLAFGIVFATIITLALIPTLYLVAEDLTRIFQRGMGQHDPAGMRANAGG